MLNDSLANVLSGILNCERKRLREFTVHPSSKLIKKVLQIMNKEGYVGIFEETTEARGGYLKVNLLGTINKCGAIKPRFSVKKGEFEKFEKRYLPAKDIGIIIVSTPKGIMTHNEAKENNTGGRLIAYCY